MTDLYTIHIRHHIIKEHADPELVYELTVDQNPFIRIFDTDLDIALTELSGALSENPHG